MLYFVFRFCASGWTEFKVIFFSVLYLFCFPFGVEWNRKRQSMIPFCRASHPSLVELTPFEIHTKLDQWEMMTKTEYLYFAASYLVMLNKAAFNIYLSPIDMLSLINKYKYLFRVPVIFFNLKKIGTVQTQPVNYNNPKHSTPS